MSIGQVQARIEQIRSRFESIPATFSSYAPAASSAASASGFSAALAQAEGAVATGDDAAPSGVSVSRFSRDVLTSIGAPVTASNMAVMSAWIKAEGTSARFNPLATVRKAPGATDFNSVGVKNFTSYEQGLQTTLGAINNGLYDDVIAALRRGNDAYAVADAIEASPWGTGGLVTKVLQSRGVPRL